MVSRTSIYQPGEFAHGNQEFFTVFTLVDITDTGVKRGTSTSAKQAQNLSTLLQAVGLRCQPIISSVLKIPNSDLSEYAFGTNHATGTDTIWALKFATEHSDQTNVPSLTEDLNNLPIYTGLDETVVINSVSTVDPATKNIYFIRNTNL